MRLGNSNGPPLPINFGKSAAGDGCGTYSVGESADVRASISRRFKVCLAGDVARAQVDADTAAGRALVVTGTPTLFVNGRPMPGALPLILSRRPLTLN